MDYKKPADVVATIIQSGIDKIKLTPLDLMIRGILSGAILGFGTTLAITASVQTGLPIIGALIFPACFVIVVLMGFDWTMMAYMRSTRRSMRAIAGRSRLSVVKPRRPQVILSGSWDSTKERSRS